MDKQYLQKIHHEIYGFSDQLFQAAVKFGDSHQPVATNQGNGLLNLVNNETSINTVLNIHIQGQATKSTARDPAFWSDLRRELEGLKKYAEEIQQKVGLQAENKKALQAQMNTIHLGLARDYIQHLVAHMLYKVTLTEGR
jgi:hypothetical protein